MILTGRGFLYHTGGRRFLLTVGCGIICTWLVHHKDISDTVFQYTILGTVGAFIAGNTVEAIRGSKNAPAFSTLPPSMEVVKNNVTPD